MRAAPSARDAPPPEAFREALDRDPADIKTVVDFAA